MKLVGLVGSAADVSYNRMLLQYIGKEFSSLFELEIVEIKDIPLFNQSDDQTESVAIQNLNRKILQADGVIIATPEHNHTVTAALKSVLEWLSFKIHPLADKPVMIVGCSYYDQGTSRAQLHLRQILDAPGVNATVLPGNEFLLGEAKEAFDHNGNLKDAGTQKFLGETLIKFVKFVGVVAQLNDAATAVLPEDLEARGKIDTTIEGIDMNAEDWVEQAANKVHPVQGKTYVQLDRGILTVDQINYLMKSLPMEITYVDSNNQFLYYNHNADGDDMFAHRYPAQVGNPIGTCHPPMAHKHVQSVLAQLRSGEQEVVRLHVPKHGEDKFVVHNYQALHDEDGKYAGVNEYILDFKPIVDWYIAHSNQKLVTDPNKQVDSISSASVKKAAVAKPDAVTSASVKAKPVAVVKPDSVSSASVKK